MKPITELWAIINNANGTIKWSRGGSSTKPKIMVYATAEKAERALNSPWTKQIIPDRTKVSIQRIFQSNPPLKRKIAS